MTATNESSPLWKKHYPYDGFCFGPDKPTVHIVQENGRQVHRFTGSALNGEIRRNVYPSFTFEDWTKLIYDDLGVQWLQRWGVDEPHPEVRQSGTTAIRAVVEHSKSEGESAFCNFYTGLISDIQLGYDRTPTGEPIWRSPDWIPALVPQVWVQWHSENKHRLAKWHPDWAQQPHRIDFAMFWNNKRVAISLDGIQHYASKRRGEWLANEARYAQRNAEDRYLQLNDWLVFRIGNWELRDEKRMVKIFRDLEMLLGFQFYPDWHEARQHGANRV